MVVQRTLVAFALVLAPFIFSALGFVPIQRSRAAIAPSLSKTPSVLASQSPASSRVETDLEIEDDKDLLLNGGHVSSSSPSSPAANSAPRPSLSQEESARQLTDYMARAHEEKLRAIQQAGRKQVPGRDCGAEAPSRKVREPGGGCHCDRASETRQQLVRVPGHQQGNGGEDPDLPTDQRFVADYVVKSQQEKIRAVSEAEEKVKARYESIIAELTRQTDEFKP
jgi:hypothetical protein